MAVLSEEFPKEFNIIPIPRNSKIPIFKWKVYQEKRYDKPIQENNGNYAVICGKSSNNLLILDLDLKDKEYFPKIYAEFKKEYPNLAQTRIVQTPHGFHPYYYMKGFSADRKTNENPCYNDKNKFSGSLKTTFKEYLNGVDILGNNGYAITWNSRVDGLEYKCINKREIKSITEEEFLQIKKFFLLEKPLRMRKVFYDILNGKVDVEEQASTTGKGEFSYWKALYREVYNYFGIKPQELYEGLEVNQPSFDVDKTETQLQYHPYTEVPFSNEQLTEMFPDYSFGKPKKKEVKKKAKKTKQEDTPEMKKFAEEFLNLSGRNKIDKIDNILSFDIADENNTRRLLFYLMLSNWCRRLKTIIIIRGSSSAGKNYLVRQILKIFPQRDIDIFSSATASVFNYDDLSEKKLLFLVEMRKNESTEEIFKSIYDGDRKHKEVVRVQGRNVVEEHILSSVGIITTLSFETLQTDLINRSWILTLDESIAQTKRILLFKSRNRKKLIERNVKRVRIEKEAFLISESWKHLDWDYFVNIPYIDKIGDLIPKNPNINLRRDDDKLYHLIEVITLSNQRNRKSVVIGKEKYLFAEYEDLEIALEIAQDLYINLILHIDELKREILEAFTELDDDWTITDMFTRLRDKVGCRDTIKNKLYDLTTDGFLDKEQQKNREWHFTKLKGLDYKEALQIDKIKEDIDALVEQNYIYYSNKTKELLEEE